MKLTKCENGHFYDSEKFPECPYCNASLQTDASIVSAATGEAKAPAAEKATAAGPVTGWLVVMNGAARGRDLRLGEGRNFIGVDADGTPVLLSADSPLSARQAVVVYDPETSAFTLLPGTSSELCYLAGAAVLVPQPLAADADLKLAKTTLRFVPFCGAFRWEKPAPAEKVAPAEKEVPVEKATPAEKAIPELAPEDTKDPELTKEKKPEDKPKANSSRTTAARNAAAKRAAAKDAAKDAAKKAKETADAVVTAQPTAEGDKAEKAAEPATN